MLKILLYRLSQQNLEFILGKEIIDIITKIKEDSFTKSELIDLIYKKLNNSFEIFFTDNEIKKLLINALNPKESSIVYTYLFNNKANIKNFIGVQEACNNSTDILFSEKYIKEAEINTDQIYDTLISVSTRSKINKLHFILIANNKTSYQEFVGNKSVISDENFDGTYNFHTEIKTKFPLFEHQIKVANKVSSFIHSEKPRVLIHMPTGGGKTRTAMHIICNYLNNNKQKNKLILWVADRKELCEQAAEEFEEACLHLGNTSEMHLYRNYAKTSKNYNLSNLKTGIFITTIQALTKKLRSDTGYLIDLANKTMLMVFDEAHHIMASQYNFVSDLIASELSKRPLIGLTATPGRNYKNPQEDIELRDFFFAQKVTLDIDGYTNPIVYLQENGYLAKTIEEPIIYDSGKNLLAEEKEKIENENKSGKSLAKIFLNQITNDKQRLLLLLKVIKQEAKNKENQIMVFAPSVSQSEAIAALLNIDNCKAASITGETDDKARQQYIQNFKNGKIQILVNYDVLTTGFDAPKANVAIIARPTESLITYSQMVGRVMRGRKQKGTDTCRILSVIDKQYGFKNAPDRFLAWEDIW